jgi:hypothetical protein
MFLFKVHISLLNHIFKLVHDLKRGREVPLVIIFVFENKSMCCFALIKEYIVLVDSEKRIEPYSRKINKHRSFFYFS